MTRPAATPTVQVDDARFRVTEWHFSPGAETGWHTHTMPYVVVPQRCVSQSQNLASVWVVAEDGTVSYRRVTPGPVYGGMWCIAEGLEAGETVAASGLQKLHDGDKVSLPKS